MRRQLSRGVRVRRLVLTALVLLLPAVSVHAAILDLTTEGSSGTINGSIFEQFMGTPAGTGVIDTFIRIQGFGVQQGYNSDGRPVQYNEDTSAQWNHSLLLNMDNVPIVTKGSVDYRAFLLDINQDGQPTLSLDKIEVYLEATGDLLGHPGNFSTPIYDLDAGEDSWIMLDSGLVGGSGQGDMLAFIPDSLFTGSNQFVYLYSRFGDHSDADNGFEEWSTTNIPEPASIMLLGLGALVLLRKRRP